MVISEGESPEVLTKMNSIIRRIDLTCKLLAPVITGFIISFVSLKASAMTLALWNVITIWIEYWLFTSVYEGIPALRESSQRRITRNLPSNDPGSSTTTQESFLPHEGGTAATVNNSWGQKMINLVSNAPCVDAWSAYLRQEVVLPGVALALLFFTVLR